MTERDIFIAALQKEDPAQRQVYLDEACAQQPELRQQVENLLRLYESAGSFLAKPAAEPAATWALPDAAEQASSHEAPGAIIGPYRLLEEIGEGGFGVVFMAEQTQPVRRKVALKVLKPGMDTRQVVARFEAERQALAIMDHPNIAKVFDGGATATGRPYFVMELVKGVPITDYCDQNHLTPRQRLELFLPICQAVQHAHQKGIIHRDLKPSNVMVALYDDKPVPKVIDFGVAKAIGQSLTEQTLHTSFGAVVGTFEYMSPEQASFNPLDVDTRSDVYSLGVLMYELLTGTTPLDRKRLKETPLLEVLRIIREDDAVRPSTRLSTVEELPSIAAKRGMEPKKLSGLVRGELDWIVMKTLEKDRNRRYETPKDFAADVQRYLADEPVLACPPSALYRFRKFARRNKPGLITASLAVVALMAVVALFISSAFVIASLAVVALTAVVALFVSSAFAVRLQVALDEARRARLAEEQQRHKAELHQYVHHIALAHAAWRDGNQSRMVQLLDGCPTDQRRWEWHYLRRLSHASLFTLGRHVDRVWSVAYSPDGAFVASASWDRTVRVWDVRNQRNMLTISAHTDRVWSLAYSPNGDWIASAGQDGTVKIWDARTGREVHAFKGHTLEVRGLAFSPGSEWLASASHDQTVRIWDVATGKERFRLTGHTSAVFTVAFSPDGSQLASASMDGTVRIWDWATGQTRHTLRGHKTWVRAVAFSPDGGRLATGSWDQTIKLWDAASGHEVATLKGHLSSVQSVSFKPDGTRLASAGMDGIILIWDLTTEQLSNSLRGHTGTVQNLAYSPDGTRLASGGWDGTVRIWDPTAEQDARTLKGHAGKVYSVDFFPDATRLVSVGADQAIRIWDRNSGQALETLSGHAGDVWCATLDASGRWLASAGQDGSAILSDAKTGQRIRSFTGHTNRVLSVAFAVAGGQLASAGADRIIRIWDVTTGQPIRQLDGHSDEVVCVTYSPDGKWLASASWDRTVRLWDAATGRLVHTFHGHVSWGQKIRFSPDSKWLAAAGVNRSILLWDTAGQLVRTFEGHAGDVVCVAFSPDNTRLASASWDHTVKIWDLSMGQEVLTLKGHTGPVYDLAFSSDGSSLASAGDDHTVKLWDTRPWRAKQENAIGNNRRVDSETSGVLR